MVSTSFAFDSPLISRERDAKVKTKAIAEGTESGSDSEEDDEEVTSMNLLSSEKKIMPRFSLNSEKPANRMSSRTSINFPGLPLNARGSIMITSLQKFTKTENVLSEQNI